MQQFEFNPAIHVSDYKSTWKNLLVKMFPLIPSLLAQLIYSPTEIVYHTLILPVVSNAISLLCCMYSGGASANKLTLADLRMLFDLDRPITPHLPLPQPGII